MAGDLPGRLDAQLEGIKPDLLKDRRQDALKVPPDAIDLKPGVSVRLVAVGYPGGCKLLSVKGALKGVYQSGCE